MSQKKVLVFEEFVRNLKNDARGGYQLKYVSCEGKDEDFFGSDQVPMVLTTFSTIENPELFVVLSSKKEDYFILDLDEVTNALFDVDNQHSNFDSKKLRQQSKHVLEDLISLNDLFDIEQNNKAPKHAQAKKNDTDAESEDDLVGKVQNMKFGAKSEDSETESMGGIDNDGFIGNRPKHFHTGSNKSNKSNKSITFMESQNQNQNQSNNSLKKHSKNKQSQHSNRSSKSGDMFHNSHRANNKSVDFSQEQKDAIVDLSDHYNDDNDNNNDNDNDADNDTKNQSKNEDARKTLQDLCDVLSEIDVRIDVLEQTVSNSKIITFRVVPTDSNGPLTRQKSVVGSTNYKEWNGYGDITKNSTLLFEDSFFEDGFALEDSFVMVKFDFETLPQLKQKWDKLFPSFGSKSSIQNVMNALLKGEKNVHVDVVDKISKDSMILQFSSS